MLNAILLKNEEERDKFLDYAYSQKVMCRPAWTLMDKLPMFNLCLSSHLNISEDISSNIINIPSSYNNKRY